MKLTSKQILELRETLGLTQAQLAQLVGVHVLTISKWEREVLTPSPHQHALLEAFARAAKRNPAIGEEAVQILLTSGVAAALHSLLNAAVTPY